MRAALFSPNKGLIENENRLFFNQIDCRNEKQRYELGKQSALDSLGVQVKLVFADSYIEGYKKMQIA